MEEEKVEYRIVPEQPTVLMGSDGSTWQKLDQHPNPCGYMRVIIGKVRPGTRQERIYVHRLMLMAFIGPRPEGQLCRHLDDDPSNNRIVNLAYGTWQDNADDRVRNGTQIKGSRQHCSRLHESQIPEIRRLAKEGMRQVEIAVRFDVSQGTISDVLGRRTWKHIPEHPSESPEKIRENSGVVD